MARDRGPGKLYSVAQVREIFLPGLSRKSIYRMIENGVLAGYQVGGKWLISEQSIKQFLAGLVPEEPRNKGARL